jgi:acyl-CoA synthetase (AMP-forming)/AMP-acid ligase II
MSSASLRRPGLAVNWSTIWDRIAATGPGRTAMRWSAGTTTFGELEEQAGRLAGWLQRNGVRRGDRVACLLHNRPEYLVTVYAAMKLGAVPVNLNFRYATAELRYVLRLTSPAAVVVAGELVDRLHGALDGAARRPAVVVGPDDEEPVDGVRFEDAVAGARGDEGGRSGDDRVFLLTGGTTGMPKAVVYRHAVILDSQLTSAYGSLRVEPPHDVAGAVAMAVDPALDHPVTLPVTPLMHAMAFFNAMNSLLTGGSLVFLPSGRFDPARTLDAITGFGVTRLIIAGDAVAVPLVEELARRPGARLDSLRSIMSSGMGWSDATKRVLLERSPAELVDIVGTSEGGPFALARTDRVEDLPARLRLLPGAVLLDEREEEVSEPGAVGLLAYKGATPDGYFEDPARTAAVYRRLRGERYLVPGDWARLEPDGITMLGRGDAVVNTGAENVYPAEVEAVLLRHPAVADCVVFGVPDRRWGEIVAAAVELRDGQTATPEELRAAVGAELAGYKKPRHVSIGPIDRSATGKVRLVALRERVLAERRQRD